MDDKPDDKKTSTPVAGAEKPKVEPPKPEETGRAAATGRRQLPWAAVAVLVLLIGVGIYAAWPSIQRSVETPSFEPEEGHLPGPETASRSEDAAEPAEDPDAPTPLAVLEPVVPDLGADAPDAAEDAPDVAEAQAPELPPAEEAPGAVPPEETVQVETVDSAEVVPDGPSGEAALTGPTDVGAPDPDEIGARVAELEATVSARVETPAPALPEDGEMLRDLVARLDTLEQIVAGRSLALETEDNGVRAIDIAPLEARMAALESQLGAVDPRVALAEIKNESATLRGSVADVEQRLRSLRAELETRAAGDARLISLVFAFDRLLGAASGSGPFVRELDAVSAAATDDSELLSALEELKPLAPAGVPTVEGLRFRFDKTAIGVVRASVAPENGSWVDETIGHLRSIVAVRRIGDELEPESLDGRLMRAQTELNGGDLAQAVAILEGLSGDTAEAADDWLEGARARLRADRALHAIDARVAERAASRWSQGAAAE